MSAAGKHSQPYPWEQRKLGEIATIVGGGTPSTKNSEYWDGDINWYSPAEIGNQIYTVKSERQITELGLKKSSAKLLPVGTVLFTSRAGIGKTAILNKEACTNQGFQSIIPRPQILNSYFLFSRTNSLKQYGETMGSGSTFVEVSGKQMSKMPLFIPDINEQTRIAKLFQSLDKTITLHEEKQRQLEQLKKALLQKMFADETGYPVLRFKGFTEKWEQRKLGEIGETFSGLSGKNKNDFGHGDANFITYMNVFSNSIADLRGTEHVEIDSKQNQVIYGDILFTTSSETPEEVGMSSIWLGHTKNTYLNSFCFGYRILEKQNFDSYYMAYLLRTENFRRRMTVLAQGISRYNISKKQVMNTFVNFPTMEEQRRIGKTLFLIDKTITLHDKKIQYLKQLKRGLLQKMFV